MTLLYLVTESDYDAWFYALCAKKLTGRAFAPWPLKNRKGDGVSAVKQQLRYALRGACAAAGGEAPVAFIAAVDNDRAPHAENGALNGDGAASAPSGTGLDRSKLMAAERNRERRDTWILDAVQGELGPNRGAWALEVAVAVPVEMVESWIVRASREHPPQPMPHFSWADSARARHYYAPSAPPPQWKDLAAAEQSRTGHADKRDFYRHVVDNLEPEALARRSLSFRMFKEWLDGWARTRR